MKIAFSKFIVIISAIVLLSCFMLPRVGQYCDLLTQIKGHHGTAITEKPIRVLVIEISYIVQYMILDNEYEIFI